jgi:hypothetical protein
MDNKNKNLSNNSSGSSEDCVDIPKIDLLKLGNREKRRSTEPNVNATGKTSQYGATFDPTNKNDPNPEMTEPEYDDKGWTEKKQSINSRVVA